jgi:translation initiation factor 3 subunit H
MQLTAKQLFGSGLSWRDIFTEIPIKIHNSALVTALMAEIDRQVILDSVSATRLRLNTMPFLEKQLDLMGDCIENLYIEVQDMSKYERARARQEQLKAAWLARRQEVSLHTSSVCFSAFVCLLLEP